MLKIPYRFILAASLSLGATAFAGTYNPTTGYTGNQTNMQSGDAGVSTADPLIFNVTAGHFATNTTYTNTNVRIDQLAITNGSGGGAVIFTGAVTGNGTLSKRNDGGNVMDFVFSGNMQGFSGNIDISDAGNAGSAINNTGASVLIYGGVTGNNPTAGGTLAQGTITTDATGKWINSVAGTGALTVNNVVFNYGTDASYNYVKVTNQILARKAVYITGNANTVMTGIISGAGALNKSGTGTLTLTGNNGYVGSTTVTNGTLDLTSGKLYSSHNTAATVTVNTGATVKLSSFGYGGSLGNLADFGERRILNGGTFEVTGGTHSSGNNFQVTAVGGTFRYATAETGATLTLGGNGNGNIVARGALTFDTNANIVITEAVEGAGALNKTGTGTLTFAGANTYTGGTTVTGGTLITAKTDALGTGSVTVANGATLQIGVAPMPQSGNGTTPQSGNDTNNAVTLGAGADLLLGDGAVLKFFDAGSQITLTGDGSYAFGNATLDLNGAFNAIGVYDLIIGGNVNLGTQGKLSFLNFDHDQFSAAFNNGQLHVSVIPEPSTYGLMGAGALGAVALVRRRRKAAKQSV